MGDEEEDQEPKYELYETGNDKPRDDGSQGFTGSGKAIFLNGDTYVGNYVEGLRKGKGVYTFKKNGDTYEGYYEENRKHGFGKMTYRSDYGEDEEEADEEEQEARGGMYLGYFQKGKRGSPLVEGDQRSDGMSEGTFTYVNGDVYVGQWCDGKKHGTGTYTYAKDDTKLIGEWASGKILNGRWVFPNGTFYCGKFRYNKPFGRGAWVFKDGNQLMGEYAQKEQPTEDDDAGDPEEEGAAPKPDPKVWCHFKPEQSTAVKGGSMFAPKIPAA